jgi:hypothetical protein
MSLRLAEPGHTTSVNNPEASTVWCFFRPVYNYSSLGTDLFGLHPLGQV